MENVKRLRSSADWSLAQLSDRLAKVGRPIRATGLHRLENGKRRIDVDDLVALALAFNVSPITLLMPFTARGQVQLTETTEADALAAWDWMRGSRPLELPEEGEEAMIRAVAFQGRALPMGARALDAQLTGYYTRTEARSGSATPDWDRYEERHGGEHPEAT